MLITNQRKVDVGLIISQRCQFRDFSREVGAEVQIESTSGVISRLNPPPVGGSCRDEKDFQVPSYRCGGERENMVR